MIIYKKRGIFKAVDDEELATLPKQADELDIDIMCQMWALRIRVSMFCKVGEILRFGKKARE